MKRFSLISALLVFACAGGLRAGSFGFAEMEPAKGDKSVYKVFEQSSMNFEGTPVRMSNRGVGTEKTEIVAASKGDGKTVFMALSNRSVKTTYSESGKVESSSTFGLETCRATPGGIWVDSNMAWDDGEDSSVDVGTCYLEMRLPCAPGTGWRAGRVSYKEGFSIRPYSEAVGYEDVSVPAGTFKGCLKVVSTSPDGVEGYLLQGENRLEIVSGNIEVTSYYYPKVGMVKEVSVSSLRVRPEGEDDVAVLKMETATTLALSEYKLGSR